MQKYPVLAAADNCPYVLQCIAAFLRAGLEFEVRQAAKDDAGLRSPLGSVPCLHWQGQTVFESGPICDLAFELGGVAGAGTPWERAEVRAWSDYASAVNKAFFATIAPGEDAEASSIRLGELLSPLEAYLARNPAVLSAPPGLLHGAYLSLAIRAGAWSAMSGIDFLAEFRHVATLCDRAREAFLGRHPYMDEFAAGFRRFAKGRLQSLENYQGA